MNEGLRQQGMITKDAGVKLDVKTQAVVLSERSAAMLQIVEGKLQSAQIGNIGEQGSVWVNRDALANLRNALNQYLPPTLEEAQALVVQATANKLQS